jgi:putative ABC transport system permease protein
MSADARLGLTRRQLRAAVRIESGLVAVFGGLLGIAGGYLLGAMFQRAALRTGLLDATVPAGQLPLTLVALAALAALAAVGDAAAPGRPGAPPGSTYSPPSPPNRPPR